MIEKILEKVSVNLVYNSGTGKTIPYILKWRNHVYRIQKLGLHYTLYRGTTLLHMFAVSDATHFFLLSFDTKTLVWRLEEVADDLTN